MRNLTNLLSVKSLNQQPVTIEFDEMWYFSAIIEIVIDKLLIDTVDRSNVLL